MQWVFFLAASVLHLGNISFAPTAGGEGSTVDGQSQQLCALAAHYLQVDAAALGAALVERQVAIRGEVQHMRNTVEKACEAAEALAKARLASIHMHLHLHMHMHVHMHMHMHMHMVAHACACFYACTAIECTRRCDAMHMHNEGAACLDAPLRVRRAHAR